MKRFLSVSHSLSCVAFLSVLLSLGVSEGAIYSRQDSDESAKTSRVILEWSPSYGTQAKNLAAALKGNTTLTHLGIQSFGFMEKDIPLIVDALAGNTILRSLSLDGRYIGDRGARALATFLKGNTTLTTLTLGFKRKNIFLNQDWLGNEGAKALANVLLKKNRTLTHLDLEGNYIGYEGAHALAEALKKNPILKSVSLRQNEITQKGREAIIAFLEDHVGKMLLGLGG